MFTKLSTENIQTKSDLQSDYYLKIRHFRKIKLNSKSTISSEKKLFYVLMIMQIRLSLDFDWTFDYAFLTKILHFSILA